MAQVAVNFTGDSARLEKALARSDAKVQKLEASLKKTGRAGDRAGKKMKKAADPKPFGGLITKLVGAGGVVTALGAVTKGLETWIKNTREIGKEAAKASNQIIAFAALQEGGTKAAAVRQAAALGAKFGILDRGEAFNTVQALQSILGDSLPEGLKAAATVFAATQAGVPLDKALELEVLGADIGAKPGDTLRRAVIAGQLSGRDPALLAGVAPALSSFDDQDFALAAAGQIVAGVGKQEGKTFVKAAGIALQTAVTPAFGKTLERLNVGKGATRLERLEALKAAGIDTEEELREAGLTEETRAKAVSILIRKLDRVKFVTAEIKRLNVAGVIAGLRTDVETELPTTRTTRQIDVLKAEFANERAFGPGANPALQQERLDRARALAIQQSGAQQGLIGLDFIDEEGRSGFSDFARANIREMITAFALALTGNADKITDTPLNTRLDRILGRFEKEDRDAAERLTALEGDREVAEMNLEAAKINLDAAAKNERAAGGGVTMAPINDDQGGP